MSVTNWFTVDKVNESTYIISEYRHPEQTHCYLLCGDKTALLIDTGLGIGNIYANEILFACKIDPRRRADAITPAEAEALVAASRRILRRAIECGGTTVSDFLNVDGSEGKFVQELKIYGKAGEKCEVCGNIIENVFIGGRNSFYCKECQK